MDYQVNYPLQVANQLPILKRKPRMMAWMDAILYPQQWFHNVFFGEYVNGSGAAEYDPLASYIYGDIVRYYDNAIYVVVSLTGVSGYPPIAANIPDYWIKMTDDFRGVYERIKYNGEKITLEFILNRWFHSVFREPDSVTNPQVERPDIYIDNNSLNNIAFVVYADEPNSSIVFANDLYDQQFIIDDYTFTGNAFTIYVPESGGSPNPGFYSSLQPQADLKIRSIADRYVIAGILYSIEQY